MKLRLSVWAIACLLFVGNAKAGDKLRIEVVEASAVLNRSLPFANFAKVVLADGSHATLMCLAGDGHCAKIEPISPEKMSPQSTTCSTLGTQMTCVTTNLGGYEAERKGNQLTIRAPNGKLKFRIVGSW